MKKIVINKLMRTTTRTLFHKRFRMLFIKQSFIIRHKILLLTIICILRIIASFFFICIHSIQCKQKIVKHFFEKPKLLEKNNAHFYTSSAALWWAACSCISGHCFSRTRGFFYCVLSLFCFPSSAFCCCEETALLDVVCNLSEDTSPGSTTLV